MASAHHAVSGELSMRDERRPGLDGPGRMVKSRGLDGKISYLTKIWGFAKGLSYKFSFFVVFICYLGVLGSY